MTPEETAARQGHITGEVQTPYFDPHDICHEDPVEGRGIFGWGILASLAIGTLILASVYLKCH